MEVNLGLGKFGTRSCEYCGRKFDAVRLIQRFCGRDCHDRFFADERRRAL